MSCNLEQNISCEPCHRSIFIRTQKSTIGEKQEKMARPLLLVLYQLNDL